MISRLNSTPQLSATPRPRRALESQPAPGTDCVSLSGVPAPAAPPSPSPASDKLAETGSHTGKRVLAALGLAAMAVSLAGCNLDLGGGTGTTPTNPDGGQTQTQPAAQSLTQRLETLKKGDRATYLKMAEASYYHRVLDTFTKETDPGAQAIVDLAKKANEAWDFNGDPAVQRQNQRDVLQAIAGGQRADGIAGRYQDVARLALKVGEAVSGPAGTAAAEGFVTTLKVNGYEQALTELLNRLPEAHAHLQATTGYDPAMVRNYTEGLATSARLGLEAGQELNDPALQSVVLETTVTELYGRIKEDSGVLGTQLQTVLDIAMQLKQRFGG